ncbi:unnamed protein product [Triticum aestivum]|uniref:HMA domain-containing protein n=2 Tax=Triticinae TaxID=1648030 RepID=A0A453C6B2_AEGTS|nr:heavy metal-associated isoprenylated plant protein 47-like [Aegilops tauschii subsp. strangulata]SPT18710.1 unnamed protein product [Triticum aestivum]
MFLLLFLSSSLLQQRMVIRVSMPCDKCRSKAMELAAKTTGVISIKIAGDYTNQLEVVGDGIDVVCLVNRLHKKLGRVVILEVEEVKDKKPDPDEKKPEKCEKKSHVPVPQCYPGCYHYHCPSRPQVVVYEESGACSIM